MKVAIVILNHNGAGETIECLKSIKDLRIRNYDLRIIVVDNASDDNSKLKIQKSKVQLKIKNFELIKNENNLGYAGGNNVGIRRALKQSADWVLILNNDTTVDRDLITRLLKSAKKGVGAVAPKIYFAKGHEFHKNRYKKNELGKVIWAVGGKIDWRNVYGKNRGVDKVDIGQFEKEVEIDFASGAAMFLKAEALSKTGLFDERYFMYLEDMDLSMRLKRAGYKIRYQPKAVVWHKVAGSSGIGSNLNDYFITRNRLFFGMRYASFRAKFALVKESIRFLFSGRKWQKIGVGDFYLGRFGKGSWR